VESCDPKEVAMPFGNRKCKACGERSHWKEWWASAQPVEEHATGLEEIRGTSTANVIQHSFTRSTYASRSVLITCPNCGHTDTVRDRKGHGFW
jgi:predicted RNA-binding Zn-ribbon protein involved in translation (DUF1610 family)